MLVTPSSIAANPKSHHFLFALILFISSLVFLAPRVVCAIPILMEIKESIEIVDKETSYSEIHFFNYSNSKNQLSSIAILLEICQQTQFQPMNFILIPGRAISGDGGGQGGGVSTMPFPVNAMGR
jgi:hypothetical protein